MGVIELDALPNPQAQYSTTGYSQRARTHTTGLILNSPSNPGIAQAPDIRRSAAKARHQTPPSPEQLLTR
eukprot:763778-Hanusia_phi.AAC.2